MRDNRYRHSAYSCVRSKDGNRIVSRRLGERQRAARAQKLSILPFLEQGGIKANCSHFQTPKLHWALRRDALSRVTREAYILSLVLSMLPLMYRRRQLHIGRRSDLQFQPYK
jgi:hypothetical protein